MLVMTDADSAHAGVDALRRPGHFCHRPAGSKLIVTKHVTNNEIEKVYSFVKSRRFRFSPGVRGVPGDRRIQTGHESG
jgi:hypothetical protein